MNILFQQLIHVITEIHLSKILKRIKVMRYTKGHLRLSIREIWNLKVHLASCIYDSLLQFKNLDRTSYPSDISDEKWEEYLDKMLFSFKEISRNYKNDPLELYLKSKDLSDTLTDDFSSDAERTLVMNDSKKYFDKIKEGLNLFSKYFNDLWD